MNNNYTVWDYEDPDGRGFYHIYSLDKEPDGVDFAGWSLLTIEGPQTEEMDQAIRAVVDAIDLAINVAERSKSDAAIAKATGVSE